MNAGCYQRDLHQINRRGSHLYVACRSVSDRNQVFWLAKSVLDCLIVPFWGCWSLCMISKDQRSNCSHTFLIVAVQRSPWSTPQKGLIQFWSWLQTLLHGTCIWLPLVNMWSIHDDQVVGKPIAPRHIITAAYLHTTVADVWPHQQNEFFPYFVMMLSQFFEPMSIRCSYVSSPLLLSVSNCLHCTNTKCGHTLWHQVGKG